MVGITDVARLAGVSPGTVSHVLNRPERVSGTTRQRVEEAIRELGFIRNGSASSLRVGQTRTVGLVVLDIGNPFFAELARGVEDAMSERGLAVILCNSAESVAKEERNLLVLAEQQVRGVLITPADEDATRLDRLRGRGIAVVLVDHPPQGADQCSVAVDDVAGGEMAVAHLIGRGAERIAVVMGPPGIRQVADRCAGARRAAQAAGLDVDTALWEVSVPVMNANGGQLAAERILDAARLPDAVFCGNDLLALGVLRTLLHAGVRVPADVRLIGYDDIDFTAAAAVPLSSIRQPTYQLGRVASELLLDESGDLTGHSHRHVVFQPELVARDSTA